MIKDKRREDLEDFILHYKTAIKHKWSIKELADYFGIKPDSIRRRALNVKYQMGITLPSLLPDTGKVPTPDRINKFATEVDDAKNKAASATDLVSAINSSSERRVGRYIITSAQNNTPIHQPFFAALLNYCEVMNAELMVIPYRYKNPTSVFTDKDQESWDVALNDYMVSGNIKICPELILVGGVKIQPTATQPLSGFEGYTGTSSAIFGHPKVSLKTVPTPSNELPKILVTTGAITKPNYTDSKAGFKGEFHHSLAALIVEVTETEFHIRHIHGQANGSFYDLDMHFTEHDHSSGHRVAALITGDTHAMFLNKDVEKATYSDPDSIINVLTPEMKVFHDLHDHFSRNHHEINNSLKNYAKHFSNTDDVEAELQVAADLLDRYNSENSLNIIIKSNHDEALDRWLAQADISHDPRNVRFYHYMKYHQLKEMDIKSNGRFDTIDAFEFWCKNPDKQRGLRCVDNTVFLKRDQSLMVNDIEIGFHGDIGPNGSRGSAQNLSKLGSKMIVGHSHSPCIVDGCYQVGTSSDLNMGYNRGPSSWMTTHAIVYPDGKRTLIHVVNGKWKA